jgi:hypothetical protein
MTLSDDLSAFFASVDENKIRLDFHANDSCHVCLEWRNGNKSRQDKQSKNWHWGVCPDHFDEVFAPMKEADTLMFQLENSLGLVRNGYFRCLPDGTICTIYSLPWKKYLQFLIDNPPS